MPRTELVLELVRAGANGDTARLKNTAERMISEEKAKRRGGVAAKLAQALEPTLTSTQAFRQPPRGIPLATPTVRSGETLQHLPAVAEREARRSLASIRLNKGTARLVRSLLNEQARAGDLRANGLEPRHRLLLVGPPGNGKTSLAEAIAAELGRLFLVVRYDGLIASYLGETASRLRRVFEMAKSVPCVLFFDEIDAVAKERSDANETGEIKRVLTSLLTQIDELPANCLLIAATNHPQMLDEAVWRRFQIRLELPQPSLEDVQDYFRQAIASLGRMPAASFKALTEALGAASYSDAEELALSVRRHVVLSGKSQKLSVMAAEAREEWLIRSHTYWICRPSHDAPTTSTPSRTNSRRSLEK